VYSNSLYSDGEADPNTVVPVRVVICGGDTYVNYVLRPFVEICSKKPRGWQVFSFYVLPIGKKNDIAMRILKVKLMMAPQHAEEISLSLWCWHFAIL
jgi:hypothetical protein